MLSRELGYRFLKVIEMRAPGPIEFWETLRKGSSCEWVDKTVIGGPLLEVCILYSPFRHHQAMGQMLTG